MSEKTILLLFGTRPEAIKLVPLIHALKAEPAFRTLVCVTAQHRQMLDQVLATFDLHPDMDLDIMTAGQTLTDITTRTLTGLEEVLGQERPDMMVVHGDTTTTFAGALAAFYQHIPVAHVEAGLRTFRKESPFPEELNRCLTSQLADLHFAPTPLARQNLQNERIRGEIYVTGNTVVDAFLSVQSRDVRFHDATLDALDFEGRRVLLLTCHRRENLGEHMRDIFRAVNDAVARHGDVEVVFPVHLNPQVRQIAQEVFGSHPRVHLVEPLEYRTFANLISRCHAVLTDSGGLQEEAPSVGKPVLVLRDTTERPEAVAAGTVLLVGTGYEAVSSHLERLLTDEAVFRRMASAVNPYGDGKACQRIVLAMKKYFGLYDGPIPEFDEGPC